MLALEQLRDVFADQGRLVSNCVLRAFRLFTILIWIIPFNWEARLYYLFFFWDLSYSVIDSLFSNTTFLLSWLEHRQTQPIHPCRCCFPSTNPWIPTVILTQKYTNRALWILGIPMKSMFISTGIAIAEFMMQSKRVSSSSTFKVHFSICLQ